MSRDEAAAWMASIHDEATALFESLDGSGRFAEDQWERPGGGGGVTRVLARGGTFEKAGVNRSVVHGALPAELGRRLGSRADAATRFFAAGVSLVVHPWNPHVPTVHLNVRYLEVTDDQGRVQDAWFGGGTDLTPTWPHPEDAVHFHSVLRDLCDRHAPSFYPRFKRWCDEYFVNEHRQREPRGVGGIFFDNLRADDEQLSLEGLRAFVDETGRILGAAYAPIVERRRDASWDEADRALQLYRRGRYAEFNLVHDRGTVFGLRTAARIESVLMSLPPMASWEYAPGFLPGSPGARLQEMLEPRVWADLPLGATNR